MTTQINEGPSPPLKRGPRAIQHHDIQEAKTTTDTGTRARSTNQDSRLGPAPQPKATHQTSTQRRHTQASLTHSGPPRRKRHHTERRLSPRTGSLAGAETSPPCKRGSWTAHHPILHTTTNSGSESPTQSPNHTTQSKKPPPSDETDSTPYPDKM